MIPRRLAGLLLACACLRGLATGLEIAPFDADATPATGTHLAYDPMVGTGELSLRIRGIVLRGAGEPIVLCSVDWLGVANESHDRFRDALAKAAGTVRSRVAVHAVHQHDAPVADATAERMLTSRGIAAGAFDSAIVLPALLRASNAVAVAVTRFKPVTHVGWGSAPVVDVASNRRVMGPDGKVRAVRYTACPDPALRDAPEGCIDPTVSVVSFWNGDAPVAALTHYATHPQSYYRTGIANPDFPGYARFLRDQALPGVLHVHFNGAGGNIGAGKYNDGAPTNRIALARRLAEGMARAWESTRRQPVTPAEVGWEVESVHLPAGSHLKATELDLALRRPSPQMYVQAAQLAYLERAGAGVHLDIACLRLADIRLLQMPGELFVEYQLAAKAMRPDLHVAMAAYGDYGTAYIGTAIAYGQGGYETEPRSTSVGPDAQQRLLTAVARLLRPGWLTDAAK